MYKVSIEMRSSTMCSLLKQIEKECIALHLILMDEQECLLTQRILRMRE